MGNVLPADRVQARARQAARGAETAGRHGAATTINKACGSATKAATLADDIINADFCLDPCCLLTWNSISNVPDPAGQGALVVTGAGHDRIIDHMMMDGLEDAYEILCSMGDPGEATRGSHQFTRWQSGRLRDGDVLPARRRPSKVGAFKAEDRANHADRKARPRNIIGDDEYCSGRSGEDPRALKPRSALIGTINAGCLLRRMLDAAAAHTLGTLPPPIATASGAGRNQGPRY